MPNPKPVTLTINGRSVDFMDWPAPGDYDAYASDIEAISISECIAVLMEHSGEALLEDPRLFDLYVRLGDRVFPWENNIDGIVLYFNDEANKYVVEFTLNTAVGTQKHEIRDIVQSVLTGTNYTLIHLKPGDSQQPIIEKDGWREWSCAIADFPIGAIFNDLIAVRESLSRAAFLPQKIISTPYVALRALQIGQAEALLGCQESEWLEVKSFAYERKKVDESLWKHELAADVAQFANTEAGGLLLVGIHTKRIAGVDTLYKITPVPVSDTRAQSYRDILGQRIHPPISGLVIESHPYAAGEILCMFVPPQRSENQPYLVSGLVIHGRFMKSGITLVRRQGDGAIPITAQEVHATLVAGRAFLRSANDRTS